VNAREEQQDADMMQTLDELQVRFVGMLGALAGLFAARAAKLRETAAGLRDNRIGEPALYASVKASAYEECAREVQALIEELS